MSSVFTLTDEQQQIVQHHEGPALVFAVAGAGKTTSMVHRIRHLVSEHNVEPKSILASSFSRATVDDLEEGVREVGVPDADCRTLHSLGLQLIKLAEERNLWLKRTGDGGDTENFGGILAWRALNRLAREREVDMHALGIESKDLQDKISAWKSELCYADLEGAKLPPRALEHATQAEHPLNPDFVTLYRYFEEERARQNWITFDDMLLEGWEALMRFDEVRHEAQNMYEYVLIDEFQDVSKVQYLMLDVLTERHRNYMAVGDDDQCIYEWRGANPAFILGFCDHYDAKEYLISDNFRSRVQHTALANAVIEHNEVRREKHINLTRGFDGRTSLIATNGAVEEAEHIVETIQTHLQNGRTNEDIVILVRQYAQTPFIEQALIDAELPYKVVGNVPFYKRKQVQTLLRYLYWATLERTVRDEGWLGDRQLVRNYVDRFQKILKEPNRFVSTDVMQRICTVAMNQRTSVLDVTTVHLADMHDRTAERVERFLDTADGLVQRLDDPADETVAWLIEDLDYEDYIREHSAFVEVAEGRVNLALALAEFARGRGNVQDLLDHVVRISFGNPETGPGDDALKISSIHRAKGGEWPIVFVPGCNDGTIPARQTQSSPTGSSRFMRLVTELEDEEEKPGEEERRLFYVAVTRAQEELNLYYDQNEPISPFLRESQAARLIATCDTMRATVTKPPEALDDEDAVRFCVGTQELRLGRFLERWWDADDEYRTSITQRISRTEALEKKAQREVAEYTTAMEAYERSRKREADSKGRAGTIQDLWMRFPHLEIPVALELKEAKASLPEGGTFSFKRHKIKGHVIAYHDEQRIGLVAMDRGEQDIPNPVDVLPWNDFRAQYDRASQSGKTLYLRAEWDVVAGEGHDRSEQVEKQSPPKAPDQSVLDVVSDAFRKGRDVLRSVLSI